MTKQEQFLWSVQTVFIANAINLASQSEGVEKFRHVISATGLVGLTRDALGASGRIPANLSAADAADEFCAYILDNLRQPDSVCPSWFAQPY